MDNESKALNILFLIMLICVFLLSCAAIPTKKSKHAKNKVSLKTQTKGMIHSATSEQSDHAKVSDEEKIQVKKAEGGKDNKAADGYDVIAMKNPLYKKHKKGIVLFTHKKHFKDYQIACGDCHHDDKGKPLELSEGDPVQNCIECHPGTEKPKGEKLSKIEKVMKYHFEAVHANCIDCHKKFNIDNGDPKGKKPAPVSCGKCHPKTK